MNFELFFKNQSSLRRILDKYAKFKPKGLNLPNKHSLKGKYYRNCLAEILKHPSKISPTVHYSLQHEFIKDQPTSKSHKLLEKPTNKTYDNFVDFLQTYGPDLKEAGGGILLVSGTEEIHTYGSNCEEIKFDSSSCLEKLKEDLENVKFLTEGSGFSNTADLLNIPDLKSMFGKDAQYIPNDFQFFLQPQDIPNIGVVFNPYDDNLEFEKEKLKRKLSSGIVKSVWLQFGTDLDKLEAGVKIIRNIEADIKDELKDPKNDKPETKDLKIHFFDDDHHLLKNERIKPAKKVKYIEEKLNSSDEEKNPDASGNQISIHGSIFIPTPGFLEKFKVRPWTGISCSDVYLESEESAIEFSKRLLGKYNELGVNVLLESPIITETDEEYLWKIFDKQKFEERINRELEEETHQEKIIKDEKRSKTNNIKNKTGYSVDEDKLKQYEKFAAMYENERPWY